MVVEICRHMEEVVMAMEVVEIYRCMEEAAKEKEEVVRDVWRRG